MMRSFYHYMMRYRGNQQADDEKQLAEWMFEDHSFPKQSTSYHELSNYLELNIPFSNALVVFDQLFDHYQAEEN